MSEGLNRVTLLGFLGADPELRMTQGGQAILKMRVATTTSYIDRNNTRKEQTEWHSVSLWGKRGEALSKFLAKGHQVYIEGSLRTSSYEKDGEKRYRTEVNASNVIVCGGKSDGAQTSRGGNGGGRTRAPEPAAPAPADDFGDYGGGDDDIPFIVDATVHGRWDRP